MNRNHTIVVLVLAVLAVAVAVFSCQRREEPVEAAAVRVPGSGACTRLLEELAAAYGAAGGEKPVIVPARSGSDGAVRAVLSGEAQLGRVCRRLRPEELERGLEYVPLARDLIVFCVDSRVNVTSVTSAQLASLFSGDTEDWFAVGGYKVPVRVLVREPGESALEAIRRELAAFRDIEFSDRSKVVFDEKEMLSLLDKYRTAVGWLTRSTLIDHPGNIVPLTVDGAQPTTASAASGAYRLTLEHGLIYRRADLSPYARRFLDYATSDAGRALMRRHGLLPPREAAP